MWNTLKCLHEANEHGSRHKLHSSLELVHKDANAVKLSIVSIHASPDLSKYFDVGTKHGSTFADISNKIMTLIQPSQFTQINGVRSQSFIQLKSNVYIKTINIWSEEPLFITSKNDFAFICTIWHLFYFGNRWNRMPNHFTLHRKQNQILCE